MHIIQTESPAKKIDWKQKRDNFRIIEGRFLLVIHPSLASAGLEVTMTMTKTITKTMTKTKTKTKTNTNTQIIT